MPFALPTSAPCFGSSCTTSRWPLTLAMMRGVDPVSVLALSTSRGGSNGESHEALVGGGGKGNRRHVSRAGCQPVARRPTLPHRGSADHGRHVLVQRSQNNTGVLQSQMLTNNYLPFRRGSAELHPQIILRKKILLDSQEGGNALAASPRFSATQCCSDGESTVGARGTSALKIGLVLIFTSNLVEQ